MNVANIPQITTVSAPFPSWQALLLHLIGSNNRLVFQVRRDGKKFVFPTPVETTEIPGLIEQHLAGQLDSRLCMRQDGSSFTVGDAYAIGAYTTRREGTGFVSPALVLDIDGPDHAAGTTAEQVEALATAAMAVLTEAGLNPILERSHGGKGYHVWVIFAAPVEAGFAQALGQRVCALIPGGEKIEVFPKQSTLRQDSYGSAIALPGSGKPPGPEGGTFWRGGEKHGVECVGVADPVAIAQLHDLWLEGESIARETAELREIVDRFARKRHPRGDDPKDFTDLGLELICRQLGDVCDDYAREPHILRLICPHHHGDSLHVCPREGWWKCHACEQAGAKGMAVFLLATWLMVDATEDQVLARLIAIRGANA